MPSLTHAETYKLIKGYRQAARDLYDGVEDVKVPLHAGVQLCEGGAFVEAVVWVPKELLAAEVPK